MSEPKQMDSGGARTDRLTREIEAFFKEKGIRQFLFAFEDPDTDCYALAKSGDIWALGAATAIREKLMAEQLDMED